MTDSTPLDRKIERMEKMVMGPIVGSGADWRDRLEQTWRELRTALDASNNDELVEALTKIRRLLPDGRGRTHIEAKIIAIVDAAIALTQEPEQ